MIAGVPFEYVVILALVLFGLGTAGMLLRRNLIVMLMSVELMLNAANLLFIAYSRLRADEAGQIVAFFIMALAAAEAAVGLALVIAVFRHYKTLYIDRLEGLKG